MPGFGEPVVLEPPVLEPPVLEPVLEAVALVAAVFVVTFAPLLAPPTLLIEDTDAVETAAPVVPLVVLALVCADVVVGPAAFVVLRVADVVPAPLGDSEFSVLEHPICENTSVGKAKSLLCFM